MESGNLNEDGIQSVPSYLEPLGTPSYMELLETDKLNEGILRNEDETEQSEFCFVIVLKGLSSNFKW